MNFFIQFLENLSFLGNELPLVAIVIEKPQPYPLRRPLHLHELHGASVNVGVLVDDRFQRPTAVFDRNAV
jgi:hypothetical protein